AECSLLGMLALLLVFLSSPCASAATAGAQFAPARPFASGFTPPKLSEPMDAELMDEPEDLDDEKSPEQAPFRASDLPPNVVRIGKTSVHTPQELVVSLLLSDHFWMLVSFLVGFSIFRWMTRPDYSNFELAPSKEKEL
ncbi:unnamed protein product, partial [Polarella glacialis]